MAHSYLFGICAMGCQTHCSSIMACFNEAVLARYTAWFSLAAYLLVTSSGALLLLLLQIGPTIAVRQPGGLWGNLQSYTISACTHSPMQPTAPLHCCRLPAVFPAGLADGAIRAWVQHWLDQQRLCAANARLEEQQCGSGVHTGGSIIHGGRCGHIQIHEASQNGIMQRSLHLNLGKQVVSWHYGLHRGHSTQGCLYDGVQLPQCRFGVHATAQTAAM